MVEINQKIVFLAFHSSARRPGGESTQGFQFKAYSSSSLGASGGCGGYFHGRHGELGQNL